MRQELCTHRFRAKTGDKFLIKGSSADPTKFVTNADVFLDETPVVHFGHAEIMGGTAVHTLDRPGTYVAIVDIAYLAAGAVDLEFTVERSGDGNNTKTCSFTGDGKGDLDTGLASIVVS